MENLDERLYEHPNFVWLDQLAVQEILNRRRPNSCDPLTILNNLLRWSLYQVSCPVSEFAEQFFRLILRYSLSGKLSRFNFCRTIFSFNFTVHKQIYNRQLYTLLTNVFSTEPSLFLFIFFFHRANITQI